MRQEIEKSADRISYKQALRLGEALLKKLQEAREIVKPGETIEICAQYAGLQLSFPVTAEDAEEILQDLDTKGIVWIPFMVGLDLCKDEQGIYIERYSARDAHRLRNLTLVA